MKRSSWLLAISALIFAVAVVTLITVLVFLSLARPNANVSGDLSADVEKDPKVEVEMDFYRQKLAVMSSQVVGHTNVDLLLTDRCWRQECAIGSLTADGMLHESRLAFPNVTIHAALMQTSGMKQGFAAGEISYGDIANLLPFGRTFDLVMINGSTLVSILEHSVSVEDNGKFLHMLQVSGIQVTFDVEKRAGSRVLVLKIRNEKEEFEDIDGSNFYTIVMSSFVIQGGDGYDMIFANKKKFKTGLFDLEVMDEFVKKVTPIGDVSSGRIIMV